MRQGHLLASKQHSAWGTLLKETQTSPGTPHGIIAGRYCCSIHRIIQGTLKESL